VQAGVQALPLSHTPVVPLPPQVCGAVQVPQEPPQPLPPQFRPPEQLGVQGVSPGTGAVDDGFFFFLPFFDFFFSVLS
jgi:hypothetical protein